MKPAVFRWEPRRALAPEILDRMVQTAFPRGRVVEMQPLGDGSRNANFKLRLDGQPEPVVLRIYEQDVSLCRKEIDLLRLAGGFGSRAGGDTRGAVWAGGSAAVYPGALCGRYQPP